MRIEVKLGLSVFVILAGSLLFVFVSEIVGVGQYIVSGVIVMLIFYIWSRPRLPSRDDDKREPPLTGTAASARKQDTIASANLEEEFWAEALAEYESNERRPGLWARVFSKAEGNEAVAKASYLKQRAEELFLEQQQHVRAQEQAEREAVEKARLARLVEEQRAYELLPKGHCPNCEAVIPMSTQECPSCSAVFGAGSAWKVLPVKNA